MALMWPPGHMFLDANGNPASGGRVYFYDNNTSTLKNVYSNPGLTTAIANPITLTPAGQIAGAVYAAETESYTIDAQDSTNASLPNFPINDQFAVGAVGQPGAQSLVMRINANADGTTNNGEVAFCGTTNGATDFASNGFIIWNGTKYTVPRNPGSNFSMETSIAGLRGLAVFDTALSNPFTSTDGAGTRSLAFMTRTGNTYKYDNGSGVLVSITPTSSMVAIGMLETDPVTSDLVLHGGLIDPISVFIAPFPNSKGVQYLEDFGCIDDGITDNLARLNSAFASGAKHFIAGGTGSYLYNGELEIPDNVSIDLAGTSLQAGTVTSNVRAKRRTSISNGTLDFSIASYVGTGLTLYGTDGITSGDAFHGYSLRIDGPGGSVPTGTGIYMYDSGTTGLDWCRLTNIYVEGFANGILCRANAGGWVNGNNFHGLEMFNCVDFIKLEGAGDTDGNFFQGEIQPNTSVATADTAVDVAGDNNFFELFIWDWNASGSSTAILTTGKQNYFRGRLDPQYYRDDAVSASDKSVFESRSLTRMAHNQRSSAPSSWRDPIPQGIQDDSLAFADQRFTVTDSSGLVAAELTKMFDLKRDTDAAYTGLTTTNVEIDLGADMTYPVGFGVLFTAAVPDTVIIATRAAAGSYADLVNRTGNTSTHVYWQATQFNAAIRYIRFTFTNDSAKDIGVNKIYGFMMGVPQGSFLQLDSQERMVAPFKAPTYTVATLPTASSNSSTVIFVTDESGGATIAFSDGVNWRRAQDRVIVS